MNQRTIVWSLLFAVAGFVVAGGWYPGAAGAAVAPRIGLAAALLTMSFVLLAASFAGAIRRRTRRLDGPGGCPVGATCGCGHFNFKPRGTCRQCGAATKYAAA